MFPEIIGRLAGCPLLSGNRIRTLLNGDEFFPALLELIAQARHSITIESYMWSSGAMNDRFMDALSKRAREGVKVLAISDGIGALRLKRKDIRCLKEAGVQFVFYKREKWYHLKFNVSHRTHRKTFVFDGRIAVSGGLCLDDSWQGDGKSRKYWRDNAYLLDGPVVRQVQQAFARNWEATTGNELDGEAFYPVLKPAGEVKSHFYYGAPDGKKSVRKSIHAALCTAERSLRIAHGYFVPDDESLELLVAARKRGVRVEVIVPLINDLAIGRAASRSRWDPLLEAGVEIFRFQPAMYHCKCVIADDLYVVAGSANFDNRSFSTNDESNFNVHDRDFAESQVRLFEKDKRQSQPYTLADHQQRPLAAKARDRLAGLFWRAL